MFKSEQYLMKLVPLPLKVVTFLFKVIALLTHTLHGFARNQVTTVHDLAPDLDLVEKSVTFHLLQQQVLLQLLHSIAEGLDFRSLA